MVPWFSRNPVFNLPRIYIGSGTNVITGASFGLAQYDQGQLALRNAALGDSYTITYRDLNYQFSLLDTIA